MESNDPVKLIDVFRHTIILLFFFAISVSLTAQPPVDYTVLSDSLGHCPHFRV
jgi:hypothetical protein